MIQVINDIGITWSQYFLMINIQNSIFITLALILIFLLRHQDPKFLHFIGALALIKLFIPPFFTINSSSNDSISWLYSLNPTDTQQFSETTISISIHGILALLWICLAIMLLFGVVYRFFRLRGIYKNALPLKGLLENFPLKKRIKVYRSAYDHSPFIMGIYKRRIVLPRAAAEWPEQDIKAVLAHEVAHIHYQDNWINLLQVLSQIIYFFNPLVWIINQRLSFYREMRCDDLAINYLRQKPLNYVKSILNIAETIILPSPKLSPTIYFSDSSENFKKRILYQLNQKEKKPVKKWNIFYIVMAICLSLFIIPLSCDWNTENNDNTALPTGQARADKTDDDIISFSELTEKPKEIERVSPKYPKAAKEAGIEGSVIIKVLLGKDGLVEKSKILKSIPELDAAAVKAAENFKFIPAKKDGRAVKVWVTIPFNFRLK